MAVLWASLLTAYCLAFFARYFSRITPSVQGPYLERIHPNRLLATAVIFVLAIVSGLRNNIGDTFFYMHSYKITDFRIEMMEMELGGDFGFNLYQLALQQISKDPQILIFVTSIITILLIGGALLKYSRLFELSIYVFITGGMYITSMNGIRQFMASAIVFAASKYLFEGRWRIYFPLVLLAATIHTTALILIPIYFLVRRKAWTKGTFIALSAAVMMVVGFNAFSEALFTVLEETKYGEYKNFNEGGASIIRVIIYVIPLILAYFGRDKLRELTPNSDFMVNMSMLGLVFMLISTQNWIFARFSIYFGLYQILLLTWAVKLFREKDQRLVYFAILLFYLVLFYFESVMALNIVYESDYFEL